VLIRKDKKRRFLCCLSVVDGHPVLDDRDSASSVCTNVAPGCRYLISCLYHSPQPEQHPTTQCFARCPKPLFERPDRGEQCDDRECWHGALVEQRNSQCERSILREDPILEYYKLHLQQSQRIFVLWAMLLRLLGDELIWLPWSPWWMPSILQQIVCFSFWLLAWNPHLPYT